MISDEPDDLAPTEGMPTRSGRPAPAVEGALAPGARLGRYRIEALLGRGGMGEVYRAQQLEPVHRTVALKLLHARRLDARHLAYFEVERQLLAQMKHPAIAQVFDAGATPEGFPFFAMEFIEGEPLTRFCEERKLPLRARIELFIRICEGVQHAHQKGVIHRDLKPGNILVADVDGRALPKIIDFGIATAARRSLAAGEHLGEFERAGTPDYMSPEQAGLEPGIEVDTRSDVYSLGVLLYELLTGRRPGVGADTSAAARTASTSLRPPWDQIATLAPGNAQARAEQLGLSRPRLRRLLRTELDWVVMKAMRRDRGQRYASAAELAEELHRFLDDRLLAAVPHTRRYVVGTWLRRHRAAALAGAAIAAALVVGLGMSLYGLQQAREQRAVAELRSAELERVVAFQQNMLEGVDIEAMGVGLAGGLREQIGNADPERLSMLEEVLARTSPADLARSLVDRNILASASRTIDADFADQPALAADLRESVAEVHEALGLYPEAAAGFGRVADYRDGTLGPGDPESLRPRIGQAGALLASGDREQGGRLIDAALEDSAGLPADDEQRVRLELLQTDLVAGLGDRPRALAMQQALYDRVRAARGDRDPSVLSILNNLAISLARTGELPRGRALFEQLYPLRRDTLGAEHTDTLNAMSNLATMRAMMGDIEDAYALQSELVAIQTRRLGSEHPSTLSQRSNLTNMLMDLDRMDEAEPEIRAVLDARNRVLGPDSADSVRSRLNLASLLARTERFDEALALQLEVIAARERRLGPQHPDTIFILVNRAGTLQQAGRDAEALERVREVLPLAREVLGPKHHQMHAALMIEANSLRELGDVTASLAPYREVFALRVEALGEKHVESVGAAWSLARALREAGQADEAQVLWASHVQPLLDAPADSLSVSQREMVEKIREDQADAADVSAAKASRG